MQDFSFATCADSVIAAAARLATRGWTPATSSNFSQRMDAAHAAITASGRDKGHLTPADMLVVDLADGHPVDTSLKPSAETALHVQIYQRQAGAGAVLHTHSHNQSVASRLYAGDGAVRFAGWELQKAIAGHVTHDDTLVLPVFPNSQDMRDIAARVDAWLDDGKPLTGYLIEGHGLYTWGRDMAEALRHIEAFDFLLGCELDLKRLSK
ncbi:MAG TPA: methylthioribulose 1-phosphate dehydratase [Rhodanobacteraceae bacterium]